MLKPDALESYSVILLECQDQYLLLKRSANKIFAPGLWTGVGGKVEAGEFGGLAASGLRELKEETGIDEDEVRAFMLRRAVLVARPGRALTVLLYFTGHTEEQVLPVCPEGTLAWLTADEVAYLEIVETSRPVLPLLIEDLQNDPLGCEPARVGLAVFDAEGKFKGVVWG